MASTLPRLDIFVIVSPDCQFAAETFVPSPHSVNLFHSRREGGGIILHKEEHRNAVKKGRLVGCAPYPHGFSGDLIN